MPSLEKTDLSSQRLQGDLRARTEVRDHFCRGNAAEPAGYIQSQASRNAEQEAGGKLVAGACGVDDALDALGVDDVDFSVADNHCPLLGTRDRGGLAPLAEGLQGAVEAVRLEQRLRFLLIGKDDVDVALEEFEELLAPTTDAKRIGQREGDAARCGAGMGDGRADGRLCCRRIPELALDEQDAGIGDQRL